MGIGILAPAVLGGIGTIMSSSENESLWLRIYTGLIVTVGVGAVEFGIIISSPFYLRPFIAYGRRMERFIRNRLGRTN